MLKIYLQSPLLNKSVKHRLTQSSFSENSTRNAKRKSEHLFKISEKQKTVFKKKNPKKQIKNQQYVILMVANGVAHFCIRWCPHFYFTDYGVLKKMAHLVFPLLILTFKKLLKSQIFISPQGKTLGRDLYMAFPLVKHLLYVQAPTVEKLLKGPRSHYQWTYCRSA